MNGSEAFLRPGSLYFEQVSFVVEEKMRFAFDRRPLPHGWTRYPAGARPWTAVRGTRPLPLSGWKIHVSAVLDDAEETLDIVAEECLTLGVEFKYMPSRNILHLMEQKYAPRMSSGKFITIYPYDEQRFEHLIERLSARLVGRPGAVAVTDLPVPGCPIGMRYGAFQEEWIGLPTGLDSLACRHPDGRMHIDARTPWGGAPEGGRPPAAVESAHKHRVAGESDRTLNYTVTRGLHRSNGGGVYDAQNSAGKRVVLKEGRRYTGLGLDGRDAASSLADEARALRMLEGIPGVPRYVAEQEFDDRLFLAMEFMDGSRASEFIARHHPGMYADPAPSAWVDYGRRVKRIVQSLREVIGAVHARGWSFGDLHPGNVLIGEDDTISLIDFETASDDPAAAGDRFTVAPGFRLQNLSALEADLVRIDLIHLWLLSPDNAFWEFSDEVLAARIRQNQRFLPSHTVETLMAIARGGFSMERWGIVSPVSEQESTDSLRKAARETLMEAAHRWAQAGNDGPAPVDSGSVGWSFGGGMAGVLWALQPWADERLDAALDRLTTEAEQSPRVLPGLFTGRAGVALVLNDYGRVESAESMLDRALYDARRVEAPGLESGLAGIGWAALSAGRLTEACYFARRALDIVESGAGGRGLLEGGSGAALLAVRLAETMDDDMWLERAHRALARDRRYLVWRADGTVLLDRGNLKQQPDLGYGSLGVAFVAHRLERLSPESDLSRLTDAAGRTCLDMSWATQGLMRGRTGALAYLAERDEMLTCPEERLLAGNLRALRSYLVRVDGRLHLPGHLHLRFSHSLASGLAGAVRVLDRLQDRSVQLLPGLEPLPLPIYAGRRRD